MRDRIHCSKCGKSVSSPVPENTIVRAWVECPECIEKESKRSSLSGVWVREKCKHDMHLKLPNLPTDNCPDCHGSGYIERQAEWEDVDIERMVKRLMWELDGDDSINFKEVTNPDPLITKSGGRLFVK